MKEPVYPTSPITDPDEGQAYTRAERRRMFSTKMFNRLRIDELIKEYNHNVELKACEVYDACIADGMKKGKANEAKIQYRKRHAMDKTKLAAAVFPDNHLATAKTFIAAYNSGERFPVFTPAVMMCIAAELKCSVCDLFEVQ